MTSFLYLRSPRELMRIAGSFPFLPQRLIVRGETRRSSDTSLIVKRSGKLSRDIVGLCLDMSDIVRLDYTQTNSYCQMYHAEYIYDITILCRNCDIFLLLLLRYLLFFLWALYRRKIVLAPIHAGQEIRVHPAKDARLNQFKQIVHAQGTRAI